MLHIILRKFNIQINYLQHPDLISPWIHSYISLLFPTSGTHSNGHSWDITNNCIIWKSWFQVQHSLLIIFLSLCSITLHPKVLWSFWDFQTIHYNIFHWIYTFMFLLSLINYENIATIVHSLGYTIHRSYSKILWNLDHILSTILVVIPYSRPKVEEGDIFRRIGLLV